MQVRPAKKSDIADISALAVKTFTETFAHGFTKEELEYELRETRSEKYFHPAMEKDDILVACIDNNIIGYIQLSDVKETMHNVPLCPENQSVNALYIHSDYQGKNIGTALIDAAFEHPRFQKAERIYLDVWGENKRAYNFYLKYGFKESGTCDVIVDGKIIGTDIVMMKETKAQ